MSQLELDPRKPEAIAEAVAKLSPDEALFFIAKLEAVITKRKIQLTGYLVALVLGVLGLLVAMLVYGSQDGFVGWVFLIPMALVGGCLWAFGRWAEHVGKSVQARALAKDAVP